VTGEEFLQEEKMDAKKEEEGALKKQQSSCYKALGPHPIPKQDP